jgi:hypothetical protein
MEGYGDLCSCSSVKYENISPHVVEGHYDLVGPNGDIIFFEVWENVIEPDWTIKMHIWKDKENSTGADTGSAIEAKNQLLQSKLSLESLPPKSSKSNSSARSLAARANSSARSTSSDEEPLKGKTPCMPGAWLPSCVLPQRQPNPNFSSLTSRVEGSHAVLKQYIGGSTGDILFVFERINNALQDQHYTLSSNLAEDRIETLDFCSHYLYSNKSKRTSRYSISLISNQAAIAKRATPEAPLSNCTNIFTRTMGIPCAHRIARLLIEHQPIPLSDIHQFWRLGLGNESSEYLPILDPLAPLPPPRIPNKDTSYQRNKTSDQRVIKKKAPSKCSNCGEIGHTIRSCRV